MTAVEPEGQIAPKLQQVPTRVCLAGDALDYLGGLNTCAAIDLPSEPKIVGPDEWLSTAAREYAHKIADFLVSHGYSVPDPLPRVAAICRAPSPGGLGTSTSLVLALMWALTAPDEITWTDCMDLAYKYEFQQSHGGGADHLAIVKGGYTLSRGIDGSMPELISKLPAENTATWMCTIVHTGIRKSCTDTIARVRQMAARDPHRIESYIADCDEVTMQAWGHIRRTNLSGILQCIETAHRLHAHYLDVTSPTIENLRNSLRRHAGIPFKLTGSGEGGCLFTLHEMQDHARILKATETAGAPKNQVFQCQLSQGAEIQWKQTLDSTC